MTPDRNSYADIWEMLDGKYAERVRVTDAALVGDEEIVRRWPEIGQGYLSRCMTALKLFTDAKNSTAKSWVENPVCGRETFPGIYRVVTVDVDVQKPGLKGIIQTLRKGWAQTPVWTEARLLEEEAGPANNVSDSGAVPASDNPTRFLKIKFPNCDPGKVEAIASSLGGVPTYSNVAIRGESYSGTWNTVWVATKLEDDGSGTVTLYLALGQYNIKSYDNFGTEREQDVFYVYDCPKNEAQTIVDAWKEKYPVGSSSTTNYSRSNGLVDLVLRRRTDTDFKADFGTTGLDCRYTETQTAIFGTADDEAYAIPAVAHDAGISYTRTVRSNGDGTFDVILTMREVRYRNIDNLVVEQTGDSKTIQRQQLGLTDETPEPMTEEDGALKTQRVEVRDDCSRDITTNTETGKEQVTTEKTVARSYEEETTETTYQDAELPPPTQETGKIKTVRNTPSKYVGRWNVLERIRTILHLPSAVRYDNRDDAAAHGETDESLGVPNVGGVAVELTALPGTAVKAQVRYDKESDTLDVSKDTIEVKEQVTEEITEARSFRETTTQKTAQAVALPNPIQETGKIKTVRNEASDFVDRFNTTERVREIKQIDEAVEYDSRDDAAAHGRTEESTGVPNTSGVAVVLSADAGTAVRAQVRYDKESDTLDVSKDVTTAKEQVTTEKTEARSYRETTTQKTAQAAALPDPVEESGFIKTVRNEASDYANRYNTTERIREIKQIDEAVEYDHADDASVHGRTVERLGRPNAGVAVTLAAGAGEALSASVRYDKESDTLDVEEKTLTVKPQESTRKVEAAGFSETTTEKTAQASAAPDPAAVDGHVKTARSVASRFEGKYDTEETDREVKALDATARGGSPLWDVAEEVHANASADMAGQAAGGVGIVVESSSRKNDAGRFDNQKRTRTAKPFGPKSDAHGTPLVDETTEYYRNQDAFPSTGAPAVGSTVDVSGSINDAGKIDYQKTTRTAKPFGPKSDVHGTPLYKETTEYYRNQDAFPNPGDSSSGSTIDVSGNINDAGKIDYQKTTRTAKLATITGASTGFNEFFDEKTDIHLNADSVAVSRASGEVVDASVTLNEFGKQDVSIRKSTAKQVVSGPFTEHDDGYKKTTKTIHRNIDSVPNVAHDDNGHDISVQVNEHGKKDVVETKTTVSAFDIDIDEPSTGNQAPRYQRICYGLRGSGEIQPKVNEFKAKVAAQTGHMYRITASVHRDESGFYVVTLTANPKDSSGGGGSAQQWEEGLDIDWPEAVKYGDVTTTKAFTKLTSSRAIAQTFVDHPHGVLVDSGVGGQTGAHYIGRGRFLVVKNIKVT